MSIRVTWHAAGIAPYTGSPVTESHPQERTTKMMTLVLDVADMGVCTHVAAEPCGVCGERFPTYMMRIQLARKVSPFGVRRVAVFLCDDCEEEALSRPGLAEAA
jgi:hypothetical protein